MKYDQSHVKASPEPGHGTSYSSPGPGTVSRPHRLGKVKTRLTSFNSDDEMGQEQKKLTRYNRFQVEYSISQCEA